MTAAALVGRTAGEDHAESALREWRRWWIGAGAVPRAVPPAADGMSIFGLRLDDNLHLQLGRLGIDGKEHIMADLGIAPPATVPLDGFSLSPDGKTLITSLLKPKDDLWMLEGFEEPQLAWCETLAPHSLTPRSAQSYIDDRPVQKRRDPWGVCCFSLSR